MNNSDVISFFKKNPALSLKKIEEEAGIPNYLSKVLKGTVSLNETNLLKLHPILVKYGYKESAVSGAKVIAIANHKGGVAKTTTSVNLAKALQLLGKQVLLVDLDPQGNASQALNFLDDEMPEHHLAHALTFESEKNKNIVDCIYQVEENLDICPTDLSLSPITNELINKRAKGYDRLNKVLYPAKRIYDYIIIDTPPNLDILTANAICACTSVVVTVQPEYSAYRGLNDLFEFVFDEDWQYFNKNISIEGIVYTLVDQRKKIHQEYMQVIREEFARYRVFDTFIRSNVALPEATNAGLDIFTYNKNSNGAIDYMALAKEVDNG
ncbi:MAG: ParA family protein [Cytophagales bacterium]|nr:ParA family protein [Cytophagales bacterium]